MQGSGSNQVKQLYAYDANGDVISVNYNGTEYFYLRNGQNDVVGLMDGSGTRVVEYTYDAWGKLISTTGTLATSLGADNPFRYRGYYYDTETGLYYLMTRYYDPEVCRFISADVYMSTGQGVLGGNMWAYCLNNPANMRDSNGKYPEAVSPWIPPEYYGWLVPAMIGLAPVVALTAVILSIPLLCTASTAQPVAQPISQAEVKEKEAEHDIATTATPPKPKDTVIYRTGSLNYTNLTPRVVDTEGLSFTTVKPRSGRYFSTTINTVNSTKVLEAVKDGPTHVSVRPKNKAELPGWIATRPYATTKPHPYTLLLRYICTK